MVDLYAAAAGTADVLAGWFALRLDAEKIQRRYAIAFAAGVTARRVRWSVTVACAALLSSVALLGLPLPAAAHGVLLESKPGARETAREVRGLSLRFNSRLEPAFSRLRLTGPSGEPVLLRAVPPAGEPNRLTAALPALEPGMYTVHWRILTVDGHITHGNLRFRVGERR